MPAICGQVENSKPKNSVFKSLSESFYSLGNTLYSLGSTGYSGDSLKNALDSYKRAAEFGHIEAQFKLAQMYDNGEGTVEDNRQAIIWYLKAAEQSHKDAQYYLALMYDSGEGTKEDNQQAINWYRRAAEQDHKDAQYNLALMYDNGEGTAEDNQQALVWYRRAAEQGDTNAQNNLAIMYETGEGTSEDNQQASFWYRQAAAGFAEMLDTAQEPAASNLVITVNNIKKSLNEFALTSYGQGKYEDAGKDLLAAIGVEKALLASLSTEDQDVDYEKSIDLAILLTNLGTIYTETGNYSEGDVYFFEALEIFDAIPEITSVEQMSSLSLAGIYLNQKGHYQRAQQITQKLMLTASRMVGVESEHTEALSLNQQAKLIVDNAFEGLNNADKKFNTQGISPGNHLKSIASVRTPRFRLAQTDLTRQNDFLAAQQSVNHHQATDDQLNWSMNSIKKARQMLVNIQGIKSAEAIEASKFLAMVYTLLGKYQEAEALLLENTEYTLELFGESPQFAGITSELAGLYVLQKQPEKAQALYAQALAIYKDFFPENHIQIARALVNLAGAEFALGNYTKAKPLYEKAYQIQTLALPETSSERITTLIHMADVDKKLGKVLAALSLFRQATQFASERLSVVGDPGNQSWVKNVVIYPRTLAFKQLDAYVQSTPIGETQPSLPTNIDFAAIQLSNSTPISDAVKNMALQYASPNTELGDLVREKQKTAEKWAQQSERLSLAETANINNEKQVKIREQYIKLKNKFYLLEQKLKSKYPKFVELVTPATLSLQNAQKLLHPDEALITYSVGDNSTFIFVAQKNQIRLRKLNIDRQTLTDMIAMLRVGLDANNMNIDGNDSGVPKPSTVTPFNASLAYDLYKKLIDPVISDLQNARHLIIVPDSPLESLPFHVLVTEPITKPISKFGFSRYQKLPWLSRKYAISILPTAGSLKALRQKNKKSSGKTPFIGFGDPVFQRQPDLKPDSTDDVLKSLTQDLEQLATQIKKNLSNKRVMDVQTFFRGESVNLDALKKLNSLPNTKRELTTIATYLGSPKNVFTGVQATEERVKSMNLSKARVLGFSTHALIASETGSFSGIEEPALVLTPPVETTKNNDGLLTASEIALLKLDTDWVVLAACNTAAGKKLGANGLSGLARSFFYAGSRSLLVTHWSIETLATEEIITGMFEYLSRDTSLRRAEALRLSTMDFLDKNHNYAHPTFWAPFFIVGEGGRAIGFKLNQ